MVVSVCLLKAWVPYYANHIVFTDLFSNVWPSFLSVHHRVMETPKCLKELRQQRMHLVQMVGQYKFVYTAVIQYVGKAMQIDLRQSTTYGSCLQCIVQ